MDAADSHLDAHLAALEAAAPPATPQALNCVRMAAATFKERHGRHAAAAELYKRVVDGGDGGARAWPLLPPTPVARVSRLVSY